MSAAMNGSISVSTNDGWICEFAKDGENCFVIPEAAPTSSPEARDRSRAATTSTTSWTTRFCRSTTITTTSGWTSSSMR